VSTSHLTGKRKQLGELVEKGARLKMQLDSKTVPCLKQKPAFSLKKKKKRKATAIKKPENRPQIIIKKGEETTTLGVRQGRTPCRSDSKRGGGYLFLGRGENQSGRAAP